MNVTATPSLSDINESKRFKKGAFRFCGCLPVYDSAAARLAGRSDTWIMRRIAEVHMQAMDHAVSQLRAIAHQGHGLDILMGMSDGCGPAGIRDWGWPSPKQAFCESDEGMWHVYGAGRRAR